jgi:ribosomal protein S18 acetylase RimI-like enzyme
MRLTEHEIATIQSTSHKVFGHKASVWLFGSRVDDSKRGGDIDLLILAPDLPQKTAFMKQDIAFCVQLKSQLGEQKIDTLYATPDDLVSDPFLRTVTVRIPLTGVHLVALTPPLLSLFSALHRSLGTGCYCAVWTLPASVDWTTRCQNQEGQENEQHTAHRVLQGEHVGYLMFDNSHVVGWCGAGPKSTFPLLAEKIGSRLTEAPVGRWSLACLALHPRFRGEGRQDALVSLICEQALQEGAQDIEAYPVVPSDSWRAYRGSQSLFVRHGFREVACEDSDGCSYPVMRRTFSS